MMSYAFLFGTVGVWIGYVREDFSERPGRGVEAGARIDVRRLDVVPGKSPNFRGFAFSTLSDGGIWRADLLWQIDPLPLKPCHHQHHIPYANRPPERSRDYEPEIASDPAGWAEAKLRRLDILVTDAGADKLLDGLEMDEVELLMPAMRAAIDDSLARLPALQL
jgi:hypothetical protein